MIQSFLHFQIACLFVCFFLLIRYVFRAPASGTTEDGANWSWTTEGIFNLQHSIFGTFKATRLVPGNGYNPFYNLYIELTQGCDSTGMGVKGICNRELIRIAEQQFFFFDDSPPPPEDVPPPNKDPCLDLPSDVRDAFMQEARTACSRVVDQSTLH